MKSVIEVDESYFDPRRTPGRRGRGASNKTIVIGIFKCNGKVYTEIVDDCSAKLYIPSSKDTPTPNQSYTPTVGGGIMV